MVEPHNIVIKGRDSARDDGISDGALMPGHLIEQTGVAPSGEARTYGVHSTAGGTASARFALTGLGGKGIGDQYADGEHIRHKTFLPGDEVYALLASGANVAAGDFLESEGDGTLGALDGTAPDSAVCIATEAVDNSGSANPARIVVEVI